jgi:short-subunit dehydrogenase
VPATAVVTGAAKGLGRTIAAALAGRGYQVLLTDVDVAAAEVAAGVIGKGAWAMKQDVRDRASHAAVAAAATARGTLEVWVNNAGVLQVGAGWETSEADVRRMIDVNLLGLIWGSQAAVGAMRQGGHLINIGSLSSVVPAPGFSVYGATKHAVLGYSVALEGDLRRAKIPIKVSTICPDAIETDMVKGVAHDPASDVLFSSGKMLSTDNVAAAVIAELDHPRLVRILPQGRAALVHALRPFPDLGLRIIERFAALGARRKNRHAS